MTDAQKAAIAAYRRAIERFVSAHYRVVGTGLDPEVLAARKVKASVQIDEGRMVLAFDVEPSGHAAFDEAARDALTAVMGRALPEPPPEFPGPLQSKIRITFVCRPGSCD